MLFKNGTECWEKKNGFLSHLLVFQRNLGFDGQDQIRRGVPQLLDVLVDVVPPLHPHVVVHVPEHQVGKEKDGGKENRKQMIDPI